MKKISIILVMLYLTLGYTHAQIGAKHLLTFERASNSFYAGDLQSALDIVETNKEDLQDGKDRLLYQLYLGTIYSEMEKYAESNQYFDMAYQTIDAMGADVGKKGLSMLTNPLVTNYDGEAAEQLLIHYYKIYNYLRLGESQAALSEIQKLDMRISDLESKPGKKIYTKDALLYIMTGIVYEQNNMYEKALDAYQQAYNMYLSDYDINYSVKVPEQLKKDLVRIAKLSNNESALTTYKTNFGIESVNLDPTKGQLVVFWKNGQAAKKLETKMTMQPTQVNGGLGFVNIQTGEKFPAGAAAAGMGISRLLGGGPTVMAYPYYAPKAEKYTSATVSVGEFNAQLNTVEDVNKILIQSLKDKKLREVGSMLARSLTKSAGKKLAKRGLKRAVAYIPGASSFSGLINKGIDKAVDKAASKSEHADTRGWHLLPHKISYTRLDLPVGEHIVSFTATDNAGITTNKTGTVTITAGQISTISFSVTESGDVIKNQMYASSNSTLAQAAGLGSLSTYGVNPSGINSAGSSSLANIGFSAELPVLTNREFRKKFREKNNFYTRVVNDGEKQLKHGLKLGQFKMEMLVAKYYLDENGISPLTDKVYFDFQMATRGKKKIMAIKDLPGFVKETMIADIKSTLYPNLTDSPAEADYTLTVTVNKLKASNNHWIMFIYGIVPVYLGLPGGISTFKFDINAQLKDKSGNIIAQSNQNFKKSKAILLYTLRNNQNGRLAPKKKPSKLNPLEMGLKQTMGDLKRDLYSNHKNYKN